jgi:hypothetical protein
MGGSRWPRVEPADHRCPPGPKGWRASDSSPGRVVEYAEPELKCWMPLPSANLSRGDSLPAPWEGEDAQQLDGSGI